MLESPPPLSTSVKFSTVGRLGSSEEPVVSSSSSGLSAVMTRKKNGISVSSAAIQTTSSRSAVAFV
jgi:hypothetical protein